MPWPDGYACDFKDAKFNVAQVPRVDSYRGFIFGTLNPDAPPLIDYLGAITRPIDEWLDRHPGGKVAVCEANRLKYKGNWKLAYDNSGDGYHVVFSHRSLLEMENRLRPTTPTRACPITRARPTPRRCTWRYIGNGHHFKDKRPNIEKRAGGLWAVEGPAPGSEHYEEELRRRFGARAEEILDLASSEPVNINVFPNLSLLGNHIQVFEPVSVDETNVTWYGTAVVDEDGVLGDAVDEINALRMRTQEQFPNFGEVDDLANFEEIQRGLACLEDEWVYMHRGLGIPGRVKTDANGDHHGARHRRGVHARIHQGMEAADEGDAEAGRAARAVSTSMQLTHDPSVSSYYVNDAFYRELVDELHRLAARRARSSTIRPSATGSALLIEREARLLDQLRFDEWLALYCAGMHLLGAGHAGAAAIRGARSRSRSTTAGAWRTASTACAPAMPGRRRRNRARCGWSRTSRCSTPAQRRRAHGALEFPDQRVPGRRHALSVGLVRPPLRRARRALGDRRCGRST